MEFYWVTCQHCLTQNPTSIFDNIETKIDNSFTVVINAAKSAFKISKAIIYGIRVMFKLSVWGLAILICFLIYTSLVGSAKDQERTERLNKKRQESARRLEEKQKRRNDLVRKCNLIIAATPDKFKEFINSNHKEISKNRKVREYIPDILSEKIGDKQSENKYLLKEIRAIKKMNIPRDKMKEKAIPLIKKGKNNNRIIGELQEKLKYFQDKFSTKT